MDHGMVVVCANGEDGVVNLQESRQDHQVRRQ